MTKVAERSAATRTEEPRGSKKSHQEMAMQLIGQANEEQRSGCGIGIVCCRLELDWEEKKLQKMNQSQQSPLSCQAGRPANG